MNRGPRRLIVARKETKFVAATPAFTFHPEGVREGGLLVLTLGGGDRRRTPAVGVKKKYVHLPV